MVTTDEWVVLLIEAILWGHWICRYFALYRVLLVVIESNGALMTTSSTELSRELISLVMPAYNEQEAVLLVLQTLDKLLSTQSEYRWELVFVNDGSTDRTLELASTYRAGSYSLVVVDLSRNFGKESALSAGLQVALGDAVIPLDADLQDPPELVFDMLRRWKAGAEVVVAKRSDRSSDGWGKRITAALFYRFFNRLSDVSIPENVGDFRLMSRPVVDVINRLPENRRFMKGLFAWAGFRTEEIEYVRPSRAAGETKFNAVRLTNLAIEGITSFSTAPLRLVTYAGMCVALAALAFGGYVVIHTILHGRDAPGYASIVSLLAFLSGVQLLAVGVVGEYVGRTYIESKSRPPYVIRRIVRSAESE
jgi:polyisoprenyl-phosphate glycosyltransferase